MGVVQPSLLTDFSASRSLGRWVIELNGKEENALKKFQADRSLQATGSIDDSTSRQMLNLK